MSRYITTTLPYVNADPHIGFALELVQADTLARGWRARGEEVFFSTGTDEHGQKIAQAAAKAGEDPQTYADRYAAEVFKLKDALALSTDGFIRTSSAGHKAAASEMWRRCEAAGDIYKKSYTGVYCVGCEAFKTEKELVDGKCPLHPSLTPETVTEENYFFRFSRYQDELVAYLSREDAVVPGWRREEALNFVKGGLEDFSISRERSRIQWGVPVPTDDTQVMYVWFDALTSYISVLGWPVDPEGMFEKFWQEGRTLQVAGKDQVRFQSLMWQAMLLSAGIRNTDQVFYHGFINSGGQRMSKSLGNVISPYDLVEKYGTDATRYILLRHVHPVDDSDVTWERLDEWYTANLANGLGNLVARVMKLASDNLSAPVKLEAETLRVEDAFAARFDAFAFNEALDHVFGLIKNADAYMTAEAPYKKVKSDNATERKEGIADIEKLARQVARIAAHLAPFMPATSSAILDAVRANKKPENLFPRL